VLAALVAPALGFRVVLGKVPFDPAPIEQLRAADPEFLFIGDSMLDTRIDREVLRRETGRRIAVLAEHGSASARWWLVLKNHVVAAGIRPKVVFLFFRDRTLSWPEFRTEDQYRDDLEVAAHPEEPEMEFVLGTARRGPRAAIHRALDTIYPLRLRQGEALDRIEERALKWTPGFRRARGKVRDAIEDTFDIRRLRSNVGAELASDEGPQISEFDPDPANSFLPHMAALAREHGFRLHLVRVKRRPNRPDNIRYDKADLTAYIASLRAWCEAEGVGFTDFTADPAITLSMYADGDHVSESARPAWTRHFIQVMGETLR